MKIEELADLIERNPTCDFQIDNDQWYIIDKDNNEIASSDDMGEDGDWYSGGNIYGSSLASAMVILLNRRGFSITAGSV